MTTMVLVLCFVLCFCLCFKNGDRFGDSLLCLRPMGRNKSYFADVRTTGLEAKAGEPGQIRVISHGS
jgi:hypothetical protein